MDYFLIALVCSLNYCGLLAIQNAAPELYRRQMLGFIVGAALMLLLSIFDYHYILKLHWLYYVAAIGLLMLVLRIGSSGGGAQRWISLFGITFQPSEASKILLILFFSEFIIFYRVKIFRPLHLLACIALIVPPVFLVYKEPDFSTSLMLLLIFSLMMYVGVCRRGRAAPHPAEQISGNVPPVSGIAHGPHIGGQMVPDLPGHAGEQQHIVRISAEQDPGMASSGKLRGFNRLPDDQLHDRDWLGADHRKRAGGQFPAEYRFYFGIAD